MKKALLLFNIFCLCSSSLWAAHTNDYEEQLEAAYAAADEDQFQESIDLLVPLIEQIPADSAETLSEVYATLTTNYYRLGQYERALSYGRRGLSLDEQLGQKENLSSTLSNLAAICMANGRFDEAEGYLLRSILIEKELDRKDKLAIRLGLLSENYSQAGRLEEALERAQQALDLDRENGREDKVAIRLAQMGETLVNMCRFSEAEPLLKEAVELHRKYQNLPSLALTLVSLGTTTRALFHTKEAEAYLNECIDIAERIDYNQARLAAYMELARMYNTAKDPRAFDYLSRFMNLKDSLTDEQVQQQISDLKIQYETHEKEQEIALQEATISRQRLLYIGLAILLTLAIAALFFAFRMLRLKEQNMRLKDRFMQLISHDLKNPAIAQQRNLHGLLRCHQALEPAEMNEQLMQMAQASDAQVDLLYDLLDWAGLQTGRLKYEPIQLDLLSLAQKAIDQHSSQAKLKHISLCLNCETKDHLVKADRQMVSTILRNVLSNAIKFSPAEGRIEVTVDGHTVTVQDHGVGFDPTQLKQQTGTDGEEGTSLGLGLAHKLAQINHAKLDITSKKEVGTTVKLTF